MSIKKAKTIYIILYIIGAITFINGFLIIPGAAGSFEKDIISFSKFITLELIGFVNLLISYIVYNISENYKNYINRRRTQK
jgi:hypothetical protein